MQIKRVLKSLVIPLVLICLVTSSAPAAVSVQVNWNTVLRNVDSLAYGVNSPASFSPTYTTNVNFINKLDTLTRKKGLVRLHGWGMVDGWGF